MKLSNLPPGVTDAMIEENATGGEDHRPEDDRLAANAKSLGNVCVHPWTEQQYVGITLRQLFAAMAMAGSLGGEPGNHLGFKELAQDSVAYADALLKELAK